MDLTTGRARTLYHRMRLYSKSETVALMKKCGLKNVRVYGDFKGGAYQKGKSSHPIYIGQKDW